MTRSRAWAAGTLVVMLFAPMVHAQTGAHYRDFQLGSDLASISALTRVPSSEAKTIHARPATVQELQWRRPYSSDDGATVDPVQQITFSFYNDQLFRLIIDYDRDRTAGMTDADMVEAISAIYGPTVKAVSTTNRSTVAPIEEQSGRRVGGWGDAGQTAVLYRSSYASGFRMIVTSRRLNALARTAEAESFRLDEREAPQREIARQKKETDDARVSLEKARLANKAAFKP